MNKIFITSSLDYSEKINGIKVAKEINNINGIVTQLKDSILNTELLVQFSSTKSNYEVNDFYLGICKEAFKLSGINFKKAIVVDDRVNNYEELMKQAGLVILSGGDVKEQIEYFNEIDVKTILKEYKGPLVGISAGSMNMAKHVFCTPEDVEELNRETEWEGLGLISINIEPHFVIDENELSKEELQFRKILIEGSLIYDIYAYPDATHIVYDNNEYTLYGEAYLIKNKEIIKINENGRVVKI